MNAMTSMHNSHREGLATFLQVDPQLRQLKQRPYSYTPPLLADLPQTIPGIYNLSGGRQIGKTTLIKQWMVRLLEAGIDPHSIVFFIRRNSG